MTVIERVRIFVAFVNSAADGHDLCRGQLIRQSSCTLALPTPTQAESRRCRCAAASVFCSRVSPSTTRGQGPDRPSAAAARAEAFLTGTP